jgi:hypothetical protein
MKEKRKTEKVNLNWYLGFIGFLGFLGYGLNEPLYYLFFAFLLFFLQPMKTKQS